MTSLWPIYGSFMSLFALIFVQSVGFTALGANPAPDNWRERCRQIISGVYLQHYDAKVQAESQIATMQRQINELQSALARTNSEYDALDQKSKHAEFDKTQATRLNDLRSKVKFQKDLLQAKQQAEFAARQRAAQADERLRRFATKTETIFRIERSPGMQAAAGYGIRLDFKSACPKHRHVCPLPAAEALELGKIAAELEAADACTKYSTIKN
jgi:hypothetical protein